MSVGYHVCQGTVLALRSEAWVELLEMIWSLPPVFGFYEAGKKHMIISLSKKRPCRISFAKVCLLTVAHYSLLRNWLYRFRQGEMLLQFGLVSTSISSTTCFSWQRYPSNIKATYQLLSWPNLLKVYIYIYILDTIMRIFVHICEHDRSTSSHPPKKTSPNRHQDRQSRPTAATLETNSWRTTKESCLPLGISGKDEQVDSKQEATWKNTRKGYYLTIYMPPPLQNKDAEVSGIISRSRHFTVHPPNFSGVDFSLGTC